MSNNAEQVREFTEGSSGKRCPDKPCSMDAKQVLFIIRMVMSEMCELACTVCDTEQERDALMQNALDTRDKCTKLSETYKSPIDHIAAQADALVDSWYYSLNTAAKHGVNLSAVFDIVHKANMDKRDPVTGKFNRRESDGKIIKPANWQAPDVEGEIRRQFEQGAWNDSSSY